MNYREACKFLHVSEDIKYSPEEIHKIWKNGMRLYHPDKRIGDDDETIKSEYDHFVESIETLRKGSIEIADIFSDIDICNSISKYANAVIQQIIITGIPNKKTISQKIGFVFTSFELFAKTTKIEKINVAVEGVLKTVKITFTPSPTKLNETILHLGHKNIDEERGDIEMFVQIVDPISAKWKYDITTKTLNIHHTKLKFPKVIILPCNTILEIPQNIDQIYHPLFPNVKIQIKICG